MAIYVFVGGTDVHALNYLVDDSLSITKVLNRRWTAGLTVEDFSETYRPSIFSTLAIWDDARAVTDATMTNGSATLQSATANFVAGDVGRSVEVFGAGPGGQPLVTTIFARTNSTTVTLSRAAYANVASATCRIGYLEFSGLVTSCEEEDAGEAGGYKFVLGAEDLAAYLDRKQVKASIPAGQTLKQVITTLLTYVSLFDLVIDPFMADGPVLEALEFDYVSVADAFNFLKEQTGYVYSITPERVVRWRVPTLDAMPANITSGTALHSLRTKSSTGTKYRNRTFLRCGPVGSVDVVDDLTSLTNGVLRVFPLNYEAFSKPGYVTANGAFKTVGTYGVDPDEWTYRASDNSMVQDVGYPVLTTGQGLLVHLPAKTPFTVSAQNSGEIATRLDWETTVSAPSILDRALGQSTVNGLNARYSSTPRTASWTFWTRGYNPGMAGTLTRTERNLTGQSFFITEVNIRVDNGMRLQYGITAVEGSEYQGSWRDWYDQAGSGTGSGGTVSGGVAGGSSGGTTTVVQGVARIYLGGSETTRTKITTAGTYQEAKDSVDPILDSSSIPETFILDINLKAPLTGGTVTARVVAGSGDWSNKSQVGIGVAESSSGAWAWQPITVTRRTGLWAYRVELTSSVTGALVGFRGAQFRW